MHLKHLDVSGALLGLLISRTALHPPFYPLRWSTTIWYVVLIVYVRQLMNRRASMISHPCGCALSTVAVRTFELRDLHSKCIVTTFHHQKATDSGRECEIHEAACTHLGNQTPWPTSMHACKYVSEGRCRHDNHRNVRYMTLMISLIHR